MFSIILVKAIPITMGPQFFHVLNSRFHFLKQKYHLCADKAVAINTFVINFQHNSTLTSSPPAPLFLFTSNLSFAIIITASINLKIIELDLIAILY